MVSLTPVAGRMSALWSCPGFADTLKNKRDNVVLVSEFGHTPEGPKVFSVDWFWESLEASLGRLRTDYLDVLLLHNPPREICAGRAAAVIRRPPLRCLFLLSESHSGDNTGVIRRPEPAGCSVFLPIPHGHGMHCTQEVGALGTT